MAKKAATMTINQERDVYEAIGAFVFHFSQLEFTIRARLQRVLLLKPGYSDIVIGGYDFAMLCTVTREALLARKRISDKRKKLIKSFFNDCHGLAKRIAWESAANIRLIRGQTDQAHVSVAGHKAPFVAKIVIDSRNVVVGVEWGADGRKISLRVVLIAG